MTRMPAAARTSFFGSRATRKERNNSSQGRRSRKVDVCASNRSSAMACSLAAGNRSVCTWSDRARDYGSGHYKKGIMDSPAVGMEQKGPPTIVSGPSPETVISPLNQLPGKGEAAMQSIHVSDRGPHEDGSRHVEQAGEGHARRRVLRAVEVIEVKRDRVRIVDRVQEHHEVPADPKLDALDRVPSQVDLALEFRSKCVFDQLLLGFRGTVGQRVLSTLLHDIKQGGRIPTDLDAKALAEIKFLA